MRKLNFKIFSCILFISGCSQKIAAEYNEESNAENTDEEHVRSSRETNLMGESDDEDYSSSSGDYDDIINEDYSESEYELPVSEIL